MRAAEVVSTLAASTWNLQRHHQVGLDLLATIARRPGYRLEFGDPRAAAVAVGDALDRLTERSPVG